MRIEQIDGNKIRVFVTNSDMAKMNIDYQKLTPDSPELSKCLFQIIEHVKNHTGFNPDSSKMVIEAIHSADGLMLMLTKTEERAVPNFPPVRGKIKGIRAKKKTEGPKVSIYEFSGAENFFRALKYSGEKWPENVSAYRTDEKYYIVFEGKEEKYAGYLSEFSAHCIYNPMFTAFLDEHAEFIAKNSDLVHMAKEIRNFY